MTVKALDDEPALPPDLSRILGAFRELSAGRPQSLSGSPQPISASDILAGWQTTGMKKMGLTIVEFARYMRVLDDTLVGYYQKRKPKTAR